MKKIAILTSLLTLTACGGSVNGFSSLSPTESNARVTGMNSFVVIGGSNPTINPHTRASGSGILQNDGGVRYDLENVTFKSIPTSGVIADLVFHTDENGKIISFEYPDAEALMEGHSGSEITVGPIERVGDTAVFVEHAVLDEEFGDLAGQVVDFPNEYISYAKDLGLRYSDFGVIRTDITSTGIPELQVWGVMETPFAGGYDIKNVNNADMNVLAQNGNIVFTGLAKGQVSYHDWDAGVGGVDIALPGGLTDNAATLTFAQDGTQTLAADFTNWAKIDAVKAADGTNQFIVNEVYVANDSPYYIETSPANLPDGVMAEHAMAFQTGYYGDEGTPIEGVGLVQYQHEWDYGFINSIGREEYEHHLNVDLGFGGTR